MEKLSSGKVAARHLRAQRIKKRRTFKMPSLSKLFIARTLLCATIIMLSAPQQYAGSWSKLLTPSAGSAITCQPGYVFKCSKLGCFCVKP